MLTNDVNFKASVSEQGPFVFLGDIAMLHNNLKFVSNFETDYVSDIDFHAADPDDRAEMRRLANRQVRRRIRQELKANIQDFID